MRLVRERHAEASVDQSSAEMKAVYEDKSVSGETPPRRKEIPMLNTRTAVDIKVCDGE